MWTVKKIVGVVLRIWFVVMILYAILAPMLVSNSEEAGRALAESGMLETQGMKEQRAMIQSETCRVMRENRDRLWDRAVERNFPPTMEDALASSEDAVRQHCPED